MTGSVRFFGQGRKKSFDERSKTSSKFRTSKKGRHSPRKKPDRSIKGGERTAITTGMDKYAGHSHRKGDCPETCPKYIAPPEEVSDAK